MFCTCKFPRCTYKWTCYDPSDGIFAGKHSTCNLAHTIQFCKRYNFLVRGELKNTVRRCIEDRTRCTKMLFTEFLDDSRARGRLIAEDLAPDGAFKLLHKLVRKSARIGGKGSNLNAPSGARSSA